MKYKSKMEELKKENESLKEKLKASKTNKKDIIHPVPGSAFRARIYATEETFTAFSEMADKVSDRTGLKKYTAVALMLDEATKMFGKLFD